VDRIDREIVAHLQQDGRMTFTALAEKVRLSLSRCQRRVRDLENSGVITGYQVQVDPVAVGLGFEAFVFVTLSRPDVVEEFDDAVRAVSQVIEAQRLFGEPDYLLRVVAADLSAYQQLYESRLIRLPGVQGMKSTIVMKQAVPLRPLPLTLD
jgi:DNA-binding Lrp family transcriptional regulator